MAKKRRNIDKKEVLEEPSKEIPEIVEYRIDPKEALVAKSSCRSWK